MLHCFHTHIVLVFLECLEVSLSVTFPVAIRTNYLCIKVRRGISLLVLLLVLIVALALPFALLLLALSFALMNSTDVYRYRACQRVAVHDDALDLLSHNGYVVKRAACMSK